MKKIILLLTFVIAIIEVQAQSFLGISYGTPFDKTISVLQQRYGTNHIHIDGVYVTIENGVPVGSFFYFDRVSPSFHKNEKDVWVLDGGYMVYDSKDDSVIKQDYNNFLRVATKKYKINKELVLHRHNTHRFYFGREYGIEINGGFLGVANYWTTPQNSHFEIIYYGKYDEESKDI